MKNVFFIVGPTAVGKTAIAAEVAEKIGAEIVSADAFQIYRGLDLLTAKPDAATLARVPHHLVGTVPLTAEMNVEIFRREALRAIDEIHGRGKPAVVVGGSGLYVKALTHGLSPLPAANPALRARLDQLSPNELAIWLRQIDPDAAQTIDLQNRRRVLRAVEVILLTGKPWAEQRSSWSAADSPEAEGVLLIRDREELRERIHKRVQWMFENGVEDEVRQLPATSATSGRAIGLVAVQALLENRITRDECASTIELATRRYAKRQLTWFRHQTNLRSLNLTPRTHGAAVTWISERASLAFSRQG